MSTGSSIIKFIFFGNYFVGLLAVALSIELCYQLALPLNSSAYYLLLFIAPIIYYTYAYSSISKDAKHRDERTSWYFLNKSFIRRSQIILAVLSITLLIYLLVNNFGRIMNLSFYYYFIVSLLILLGAFYYGLISRSFFGFDLRKTGWLKAFIIGFVWAGCTSILPLIMLKIESGQSYFEPVLWTWLFIKNWMFCTVNAIIFDIKDYPNDSNQHLQTFVVRLGLRKTIYFILIPLIICGLIAFCVFGILMKFGAFQFLFNLLPFFATFYIILSMARRHKIIYYLIVIDGVILFKAICGILGSLVN